MTEEQAQEQEQEQEPQQEAAPTTEARAPEETPEEKRGRIFAEMVEARNTYDVLGQCLTAIDQMIEAEEAREARNANDLANMNILKVVVWAAKSHHQWLGQLINSVGDAITKKSEAA